MFQKDTGAPLSCGILVAADYNAPQSGNFIASLLDLAEAVKEQGGQTVFLFPKQKGDCRWVDWIKEREFPVYFLENEKTPAEKIAAVKDLIARYHVRIIHLHFGYLESLLLPVHESLGVELVIHDHFDFVSNLSQLRQRLSTMRKAALYRRYHAYCISVMEKKNGWYWLSGKKRHSFIINGLSLQRAEQDPLSVEERRREIGLRDGEKLALFLGWDLLRKGLDVAVKAVEIYRKTDPSLKIGVIGAGSDGKPSQRTEAFLRERGVDPYSDAIIYMHSYEDIFALNRAVDCYISSSRAEAFSYGILEAISQNTPVVVSDITGTRWCWGYDNCFHYPVENPAACAEALRMALAQGRAPSNSEEYVRKFGNEVWTKKVLAVYRQVLR